MFGCERSVGFYSRLALKPGWHRVEQFGSSSLFAKMAGRGEGIFYFWAFPKSPFCPAPNLFPLQGLPPLGREFVFFGVFLKYGAFS